MRRILYATRSEPSGCRDPDACNHLLVTVPFRLPGIAYVKTNVVLKEIKSRSFIPV